MLVLLIKKLKFLYMVKFLKCFVMRRDVILKITCIIQKCVGCFVIKYLRVEFKYELYIFYFRKKKFFKYVEIFLYGFR